MKVMKLYSSATEEVKVYQDCDLKDNPAIDCAKTLWRDRCQEYLDKNGDQGTCVLGAGISVHYLGPRCRRPSSKMIIEACEVCRAQGSLVWEKSVDEVLAYLKSKGIEAWYSPGFMD